MSIERSFTDQAAAFEDPAFNRVLTDESRWVLAALPVDAGDLVLDLAAGTGIAARELASRARAVVAVDVTEAMLARGRQAAAEEGLRNLVFMRGDATALPFLDGSFDVVVSRYAAHHFERPELLVAEMRRCLRAGGHLALADMLADDDPATAAEQNQLERLRDPSHARALARGEIEALLDAAGLELLDVTIRSVRRPLAPWLQQTGTPDEPAHRVHERLAAELDGGATTGMAPERVAGQLWFTHRLGSWVAVAR